MKDMRLVDYISILTFIVLLSGLFVTLNGRITRNTVELEHMKSVFVPDMSSKIGLMVKKLDELLLKLEDFHTRVVVLETIINQGYKGNEKAIA